MYDYIKGEIVDIGKDYLVMENGGIGYKVMSSRYTLEHIIIGQTLKIFVHLAVREDDVSLYGFSSPAEREMFLKLIGINGIGKKVALNILSNLSVNELMAAVMGMDVSGIVKVPGIGNKTAQRLILELKGKVDMAALEQEGSTGGGVLRDNAQSEAVAALISLGYSKKEAEQAVDKVKKLGDTAEDLIMLALKQLGV